MKKMIITAMVASGCLLGLQASSFAQGAFAFSGAETAAVAGQNTAPRYWDYAGPNYQQPQVRPLHHREHR